MHQGSGLPFWTVEDCSQVFQLQRWLVMYSKVEMHTCCLTWFNFVVVVHGTAMRLNRLVSLLTQSTKRWSVRDWQSPPYQAQPDAQQQQACTAWHSTVHGAHGVPCGATFGGSMGHPAARTCMIRLQPFERVLTRMTRAHKDVIGLFTCAASAGCQVLSLPP
jgi:hypothetical protein